MNRYDEHTEEFKPLPETEERANAETLKRHQKWLEEHREYERVNLHSKIPGIDF